MLKRFAFKTNLPLRVSLITLILFPWIQPIDAKPPIYSYDPGPNIKAKDPFEAKMAKELVALNSEIANAPQISEDIVGRQRFRPAYGPIPWRMLLKPNSVKILFIGQDGTHIAEAANRPATAGFGGRAQDLAAYFGVNESAAFINNYAFTINGQYNTANSPYVDQSGGRNRVFTTTFTDNRFWLVSQDQESPVAQWRNDLIDWIIRNNKDSLKLIVAFGAAAKDGISSFVISRGGRAKSKMENKLKFLQVPEMKIVSAGSNKQFSVVLDERGDDLFQKIENAKARAENRPPVRFDYKNAPHQNLALSSLKSDLDSYVEEGLVFSRGGPLKNGFLEGAQLGGYDIETLEVAGQETISLNGLVLKGKDYSQPGEPAFEIKRDILVVQLPHPTALSMMTPDDASETIRARLRILQPYKNGGWKIEPDESEQTGVPMVNNFHEGNPYRYARSDIGPEYYDFGTPASRMVSVSSASRMSGSGNSHIIVFGSRDRGDFDRRKLDAMTNFKYAEAEPLNLTKNLLTTRPRSPDLVDKFDPGPNVLNDDGSVAINYAQIMKEALARKQTEIYRMKDGTVWNKEIRAHQEIAISNFNIKSHPMIADFGHYRGSFKSPRVVVLADPDGYDDMITSRALTGERGQYLHGLLRDMGVEKNYLVIKTVPYGMDGATVDEWAKTLENTRDYRKSIFDKLLANSQPALVVTDGPMAAKEIASLLGARQIPVVNIERKAGDPSWGISQAGEKIANSRNPAEPLLPEARGKAASGKRANIPREHLTFYARIWEGTSGDRVLPSGGDLAGIAFAEIAPKWAWEKNFPLTDSESSQVKKLLAKLSDNKLPETRNGRAEKISDFISRRMSENPDYSYALPEAPLEE